MRVACSVVLILVLVVVDVDTYAAGLSVHAARSARTLRTTPSCPPQGSAKGAKTQALNRLKARTTAPTAQDLDPEISLEAMLNEGEDSGRFDATQAAEITGYVVDVMVGGVETANCGAKDAEHRDTHIELALSPDEKAPIQRVIVEITPRWRAKMTGTEDWSTDALKQALTGKWMTVQGWMLYDTEHASQAENTNPGNAKNWRATVWEIHPITAFTVSDQKPDSAMTTTETHANRVASTLNADEHR